ncbi:hypothetical protein JCM19039_3386 [Geomicrobium sp. JCM 19039]|nr:hypothetical protein JCM19039_3386 [Geomicrobium sp. JCM 19039]
MKKWIAGMGMLVLLTACATDEEEQTEEVEADAPESEEEQTVEGEGGGFLWKIEEGDTTVYLQGTIHTAFADMYPLNSELEAAYEEADVLLPEIDWPRMDIRGLNEEEMMDLITFDDDTLLEDVIDEEMYEEIVTIMEAQGMPEEVVNSLEPCTLRADFKKRKKEMRRLMLASIGITSNVPLKTEKKLRSLKDK